MINDIDDKLNKYAYEAEDTEFGTCIDSAQAKDSRAKLASGCLKLIKVIWASNRGLLASYDVSLIKWINRTNDTKLKGTQIYPVLNQIYYSLNKFDWYV